MALTFKIGSLAIRTLAKPLANYIKHNAREHERFRQVCISFAQNLHRVDMRLRLGLLQDPAAIERQVNRELAENARRAKLAAGALASSSSSSSSSLSSSSLSSSSSTSTSPSSSSSTSKQKVPTAKTEEQMKQDTEKLKREKEKLEEKARKLPKVRPLSEAKAIETGANFISETFLFCVAGALIGLEYWRSRRKESNRRDDVAERLEDLESENSELKAQIIRIESALEHEGVKLTGTSEWMALAKKNLAVDKKKEDSSTSTVVEGQKTITHTQSSTVDATREGKPTKAIESKQEAGPLQPSK